MTLAVTAPTGSPKRTESTAVRGIVTRQLSHDGDWKCGTPLIESVVTIRPCIRTALLPIHSWACWRGGICELSRISTRAQPALHAWQARHSSGPSQRLTIAPIATSPPSR